MKKSIKTILSVVLVIALLGTSCVFAEGKAKYSVEPTLENAAIRLGNTISIGENVEVVDTVETLDAEGNRFVTMDLSDDNVLMWLYSSGGDLITTSYYSRTENKMYENDEGMSSISTTVIGVKHNQFALEANQAAQGDELRYIVPAGSSTGARVHIARLDDDGQIEGYTDIDIFGIETIEQHVSVNIYGTYHNLASLVAALCDVLNIVASIANPFAAMIIQAVGILATAVDFYIPNKYVSCTKTTVKWPSYIVETNTSGYITGSRYVCSQTGGSGYTNNTGRYYPINSLIQYNHLLALACYWNLYNYAGGSVVSWSNVW